MTDLDDRDRYTPAINTEIGLRDARLRASAENFRRRSFLEKQTALSLIQLADREADLNIGGGRVDTLLSALIVRSDMSPVVHRYANNVAGRGS